MLPSDPTARVKAQDISLEQPLFPTDFLGSSVEREPAGAKATVNIAPLLLCSGGGVGVGGGKK